MQVLVNYVNIQDSAASPPDTFRALFSVDNGNNTGWEFLGVVEANANITLADLTLDSQGKILVTANANITLESVIIDSNVSVQVSVNASITLADLTIQSTANIFVPSRNRTYIVRPEDRKLIIC